MDRVFIAEIADSEDQKELLRECGAPFASQASSWSKFKESWILDPLLVELREVGLFGEIPQNQISVSISVQLATDEPDIKSYFDDFFERLFGHGSLNDVQIRDDNLWICFNLMSIEASKSIVDKIAQGLGTILDSNPRTSKAFCTRRLSFLFLIRESKWFTESQCFTQDFLHTIRVVPKDVAVVDLPGNLTVYKRDESGRFDQGTAHKIPQSTYAKMLLSDHKESSENPLYYQTNVNIGHFILEPSGAHVRTHYDLKDYLAKHAIIEGIVNKFFDFVGRDQKITLVQLGLERSALDSLVQSLRDKDEHKNIVKHVTGLDQYTPQDILEWKRNSPMFVILTDVVVTGKTVEDGVKTLQEAVGNQFPIKVYSVVRMQNSRIGTVGRNDFACLVTIGRDYYKNKDECPLCVLGQPERRVTRIEDFAEVDETQPTPLDFWEIVHDCDALKYSESYASGHELLFRVDTVQMVRKYRKWLQRLVKMKFATSWPGETVTAIITVDEEFGKGFAALVLEALPSKPDGIISVPREVLKSELDEALCDEGQQKRLSQLQKTKNPVLIVDDGVNKGITMKQLIRFCKKRHLNFLGALVLDSRLTPKGRDALEEELNHKRLIALYEWPAWEIDV